MGKKSILLLILFYTLNVLAQPKPLRIVTLNSAITETVDALGFGKNIVAVDVTSNYPASIAKLPKVSRSRTVSAEGILSFSPTLLLAPEKSVSPQILGQLQSAGIRVVSFKQVFSPEGTLSFIREVAKVLGVPQKGEVLVKQVRERVNAALAKIDPKKQPSVLFIYARGAGTMFVSGKGTHIHEIIALAGGRNAAKGFDEFKPYTTEALVKADPDVILLFDFGFESLGGIDAILKMPGVMQTKAGKNRRIVEMNGELLVNFGIRLDQAITQLSERLNTRK